MNFLNEVSSRYPEAVSFASGRPTEEFFDIALIHDYLTAYCDHLRSEKGCSEAELNRVIFQYGRTKGIIHDLIASQLARDESITVAPDAIVVTVGAQEAMFITLRALRRDERDVLLTVSPAYVGITGAARLVDLPIWPVRSGPDGVDTGDLAEQARRAREAGLRPRACYVMPDFANPSGVSLTVPLRRELLDVAAREGILLLEDNPYGLFHDGPHLPTLKSLDTRQQVVYLGSFAKTGFPGARIGYAVADQRVTAGDGSTGLLADELAKVKSMVTVNTSPLAQAIVGGKLLRCDASLAAANQRERAGYLRNLQAIRAGLARRFPSGDVTWNCPTGGFFIVVTLPFAVSDELLEQSARKHGVLWTPMSHFYAHASPEGLPQVRLAYSQLTPDEIETGLDRFAAFVAEHSSQGSRPVYG
jgi:(S)-3,5-dihydroxyphenylglycine transaminase